MSRAAVITGDERGPILNILTWFLLVISCLAVISKVFMKLKKNSFLMADDFLIAGALVRHTALPFLTMISADLAT